MSETLHERCLRICRRTSERCFINDPRQISCLADMLVNKAYGLSSVLELLKSEGLPGEAGELIDESITITEELINWVKYLQVTHDLRGTALSVFGAPDCNKRKEPRFPFPGEFSQHIYLMVSCEGGEKEKAELVNFSKSGLQFLCSHKVSPGTEFEAEMLTANAGKSLRFKAVARYVMRHELSSIVGASIEDVSSQRDLNFFDSVIGFIKETTSRLGSSGQ